MSENETDQAPVGCVHGRFQLLHIQHMEYILAAKERCRRLIVGITNYDAHPSLADSSDAHRRARINNPLSYYERTEMIRVALRGAGIEPAAYSFSPFPIEHPEDLQNFVPLNAICFTTIREPWNETKIERLEREGYQVQVLLDRNKRISSSRVREMIMEGDARWADWVPPEVVRYLKDLKIDERLSSLQS